MSEVSEPKKPVATDEDTVQDVRPLAEIVGDTLAGPEASDAKADLKRAEPDSNGEGKTEPAGPVDIDASPASAAA